MSCGLRKVANGGVLRMRSHCEKKIRKRPWQRKFGTDKCIAILMEKAALVPRLVTDRYQLGVCCWGHACFILELGNR